MNSFFNGLFALGLIAGAGITLGIFVLLEWFGFSMNTSSAYLAALAGAAVAGGISIVGQLITIDAARNERVISRLEVQKALALSMFFKTFQLQDDAIKLLEHYAVRTPQNTLTVGDRQLLPKMLHAIHNPLEFTNSEKALTIEWGDHSITNGMLDIEGLSQNVIILHEEYCREVIAFEAGYKKSADNQVVTGVPKNVKETELRFERLRSLQSQIVQILGEGSKLIPETRSKMENQIFKRYGVKWQLGE